MSELAARETALRLVQGWGWFTHLPAEAHLWLADSARLKQVSEGKVLFNMGDATTHVYAIVSGAFRFYWSSGHGAEITLGQAEAGIWFPLVAPTEKTTYQLSCVCAADATVVMVPWSTFWDAGRRWPKLYMGLGDDLATIAMVLLARIELLSLHDLDVRLAVDLLLQAGSKGREAPDGSFHLPDIGTQSDIALRVGAARQRVNAVFKTWAQQGIVEHNRQGTRISKLGALKAILDKSGFDYRGYIASVQKPQ